MPNENGKRPHKGQSQQNLTDTSWRTKYKTIFCSSVRFCSKPIQLPNLRLITRRGSPAAHLHLKFKTITASWTYSPHKVCFFHVSMLSRLDFHGDILTCFLFCFKNNNKKIFNLEKQTELMLLNNQPCMKHMQHCIASNYTLNIKLDFFAASKPQNL